MEHVIELSGLTKVFGRTRAVDDLSCTIEPGVVTGFLGPNGAGKSTTMRLMLGLDHGTGSTTFDGVPFTDGFQSHLRFEFCSEFAPAFLLHVK